MQPDVVAGAEHGSPPAAARRRSERREAQKNAETPHDQVGQLHHELMDFVVNDYCHRVRDFCVDHPELDDDCRASLMEALELAADSLQRLAQEIDGR